MNKIKKTIYTLNIDGYAPEITELTYPLLRAYATKIGAQFHIISDRRWPDMPPVYEKLQIYYLGQEQQNDWNIYLDSDAIVHPDTLDFTTHLNKDVVMHHGRDIADNRWRLDGYFLRDGRHIGCCNWMTVASDWCLDLWHPLEDMSYEEALSHIYPIVNELKTVITPSHLIDDYTLSRNVARYGLKFTTVLDLQRQLGDGGNYFWHQYTLTVEEKVKQISQVIRDWNLLDLLPEAVQQRVRLRTVDNSQNGQQEQVLSVPLMRN